MANRFSVEAVFKGVNRITAPISRAASGVRKATRRMGEGFQKLNARIARIGSTASSALGVAGLAGALFLVKRAMGAVITTGAELEQTLVGAAVRFPGEIKRGTLAFKELEDKAREVGRTTEFTSIQTASALRGLALAGFGAAESMALLSPLADLATAAEIDLAVATDIATGSLGAFGLRSKDTAQQVTNLLRISDALAVTSTSTRTTIEGLFDTLRLGAPFAKEAGVSLESFLAISGELGQAGIDSTRAGTAILNMFAKLSEPQAAKGLKKLGVGIEDLADGTLNVGKLIGDLRKSLGSFTKKEIGRLFEDPGALSKVAGKRLNILKGLFGLRGGKAVAVLLSSEAGSFDELKEKIDNATGATKRMADELRKVRAIDIKLFESAVESLTVTFSKATDDGIGGFIKGTTKAVRGIEGFVGANPIIAKILFGLLAVGAAFLVVGAVVAAIGAAIGFIAGSAVALVGAVFAAAVAFGLWLSSLEPVQRFFDFLFQTISDMGDLIVKAFSFVPGGFVVQKAIELFGAGLSPFGGGEEAPPDATGPADRNFVERSESESKATLTVLDQRDRPGSGLLLDTGDIPSAIAIRVDETGDF